MAKGRIVLGNMSQEDAVNVSRLMQSAAANVSYKGQATLDVVTLPKHVLGSVTLKNCSMLKKIEPVTENNPDGVVAISSDLDLENCSLLESSSIKHLVVRGDLILRGCSRLSSFPADVLYVDGYILCD